MSSFAALPEHNHNPGEEEFPAVVFDVLALGAEGRAWAVREGVMHALLALHGTEINGSFAAGGLVKAMPPRKNGNGIAVLSLKGLITPQPSFMAMLFGADGGGLVGFRKQLRQAAADPDISHIVMNIDSPGGLVDLVPEVGDDIFQARQAKPVVAVANTLAASAAYWLASQANEVVVSPSGEVGSIGVYQLHRDMSGRLEQEGMKPTLISAGKYKVEGNPFEPLGSEARDSIQQTVNDYYGMFTDAVARGRGVSAEDVANGYGEGRTMTAKRAVKAGLADRVATLEDTVARLSSGRSRVRQTDSASADDRGFTEGEPANDVAYTSEEKGRLLDVMLAGRR